MLKTLLDTESGLDEILERADGEAKRRIGLENGSQESSALLLFKVVWSVQSSFENCASHVSFFGFTLAAADKHVQSENIINRELLVINSLIESFLVNNDFVSVNEMLFHFVRKNTLKSIDLVVLANFLNNFSHFVIRMARLD